MLALFVIEKLVSYNTTYLSPGGYGEPDTDRYW